MCIFHDTYKPNRKIDLMPKITTLEITKFDCMDKKMFINASHDG